MIYLNYKDGVASFVIS